MAFTTFTVKITSALRLDDMLCRLNNVDVDLQPNENLTEWTATIKRKVPMPYRVKVVALGNTVWNLEILQEGEDRPWVKRQSIIPADKLTDEMVGQLRYLPETQFHLEQAS